MPSRIILAALADTHGGSQVGLLNPATTLTRDTETGETEDWQPSLTQTQKYLWQLYTEHKEAVAHLAGEDPIILLHVGDLTQGDKYAHLLVSDRQADQFIIAEDNLTPWYDLPNLLAVRLAKGTAVHVFGEGTAEVIVSRALTRRFPDVDTGAVWHGLLDAGDITVDYAHHGPGPGIRDWTQGNQLLWYLRSILATATKRGKVAPRLTIRAHYHTLAWATLHDIITGEMRTYDILLLPSYCGMYDYARRVSRSQFVQIHGMVAIEITEGEVRSIHPLFKELDLRTEETIGVL